MLRRSDSTLLLGAALAVGAVGVALVLQHRFGIEPCAWCTFQRLLFLIFAAFAAIGWLARRSRGALLAASSLAALAALGGLWAALHQQFVAAQSLSCAFTFADRALMKLRLDETLPWLFEATASCRDANAPLLGVPFALWSAALFVVLALLAGRAVLKARGATENPA
jgi:disulfide bond formation protein DsbB